MLLDTKDLAEYLKVSRQYIHKLRKQGLPHVRLSRISVRYESDEVLQWLKEKSSRNGDAK